MAGTTISGSYLSSIALSNPSYNPVLVTGTVSVASGPALLGSGGIAWTITNQGLLQSDDPSAAFGVLLSNGGIVTNTGTIGAGGTAGNAIQQATTVFNAGLISASAYGVVGASYVYNQTGGVITSGQDGVSLLDGRLLNNGSINAGGTYGIGVLLQAVGSVTNQAGGTITATGVGINPDGGTAINVGYVSASSYGVTHATYVNNSGTLLGGKGGVIVATGTLINSGSIGGTSPDSTGVVLQGGGAATNTASGTISGAGIGINVTGAAGTVVNAGNISGGTEAVAFAAGNANLLVIDPGASFSGLVDGGGGAAATLELASGGFGTLSGLGSQFSGFTNIDLEAGSDWELTGNNTIASGVTLSGPCAVTLVAGATLEIAGSVSSGIVFNGTGATLVLDTTGGISGSVSGFSGGNTIDLRGVSPGSVSYSAGALDYTAFGGGAASFPLATVGNIGIQPSTDGTGGADVTTLCFCAGTLLRTPSGEASVEALSVGATVLTASGAARRIAWIGVGRVLAARGRRSAATPVIVRKGALADNVPHHDLHVTKGHALLLDDVLIPVEFLVNHRSIVWDDRAQEVSLYHVELDSHDVLIANGAPAESYRDDGNRWLFRNANSGWDQPEKPPCAPVLTGGPIVDAVWRRLLDRAGTRPGLPTTEDADLHLLVDGARIDAVRRIGATRVFRVPAGAAHIAIRSRFGVPQELGLARDPRMLGVAIRRITLRQGARLAVLEADDARLTGGFHDFEADNGWRWTDGDAMLPPEAFALFNGPFELELELAGATAYFADPLLRAA